VILTCPACTARFVIPRSQDELRDAEVTHPACGHAFAPFAEVSAPAVEVAHAAASTALILFEKPSFEAEIGNEIQTTVEANAWDYADFDDDEDEATDQIDTYLLRQVLTKAPTIPCRHLLPRLAAAGFASAAAAELVFLLDNGLGSALPAAHFTLALLGMGG
jgi:predicted Zn finger-like uncharacterized protein